MTSRSMSRPTEKFRSRRLARALFSAFAGVFLLVGPIYGITGREHEESYLKALRAWLAEPGVESAEVLVEIEKAATGSKLGRLDEAQERLVNDLVRIDPASLLPLATLHREAYALHLERGHIIGGRHSAQRMRDILNLYARRSRSQEARAAAARQWTKLGLSLMALGGENLSPSIACLSEALGHTRSRKKHPEVLEAKVRALHIRAIVLERIGAPTKALDDLGDLLEIDPDHLEARLRQAISLMHAERFEDAKPRLRELAALSSPQWIGILAKQQLARLMIDHGQHREASKVLRDAVQRFPHNARLSVLLAYAERPRWRAAKRRVAQILEDWPKAETIRPRARYEGPLDDDVAITLAVDQDLQDHLDAARAALQKLEARRAKK